jgi:ABC-type Mn2+/Zn2+ transport system permease subunit
MLSKKNSIVVLIALVVNIVGIFFGLNVSYHFDFPAGSSIVAVLGGVFLIIAIVYFIKGRFSLKKEIE